jgi:hypothetical protein
VYKILRSDFRHWIALTGKASVVESVLERLIVKVLVDFTGVIQFRAAGEMGGAWYTFTTVRGGRRRNSPLRCRSPSRFPARPQVTSLAASLVATRVYYASLDEGEEEVMEEGRAWTIVGALGGSWTVSFACFLLLMKREYWATFFSTQTGHAWIRHFFLEGTTDAVKARTLNCNTVHWVSIRDDVKAWTLGEWERWEQEKPAWFTDAWKDKVDDDMIPAEFWGFLTGSRLRFTRGRKQIAPVA